MQYAGDTDGTTYTFVRNPEYKRTAPEVDTFRVKVIADNDAKLLALRSGEIDLIVGADKLSYDGFNEMKKATGFAGAAADTVSATRFIGFNVKNFPFDDVNVRLAASYGIDKTGLSTGLFSGIESAADSLFDPSMPYSDMDLKPYEYDKEKAISILEEGGWVDTDGDGVREKDGVRLEGSISYFLTTSTVDDLALALSAQLKELGMDIKVNGMEFMDFYTETLNNNFTLALGNTYGLTYDPYTFVSNMNSSLQADNVAAQALALMENGDQIIQTLNTTVDETEVQRIYDLILKEIHDKAIFIPISGMQELAVFNSDKIASYTFNGQPANVDVTLVKLK